MKKIRTENADYSPNDYKIMGDVLRLIIKRAERGLMYGPDMPSSREFALKLISELALDWDTFGNATVKI